MFSIFHVHYVMMIIGLSYLTHGNTDICSAICRCETVLYEFKVNCNKLNLNQIPTDLPPEANVLHIDENEIEELPKNGFVTLVHLTKLTLQDNNISRLHPGAFSGMVELTYLDLSGNRISVLPKDIFNDNVKLETLLLSVNMISLVPDFIPMPPLRELHLERNNIQTANFATSYQNISLVAIYLDNNPIKMVHKSDLLSLQEDGGRLTRMSLSHCDITYIDPATFSSQRNLEFLSFSYNPFNFSQKGRVSNTEMDYGSQHSFDDHSLSQYYLDGLFRHGLPKGVFVNLQKQRIRSLSLNDNYIPNIYNKTFTNLNSLKYLSIKNSSIRNIENSAFDGLNQLNILDLSSNKFTKVPSSLPGNLKILNLDENHEVTKIGEFDFANTENLVQIHLRNCSISEIHQNGFAELTVLSFLDLRNNGLTHSNILESTFSQLTKLDILLLGSNPIGSISKANIFIGLGNLRKLDISNSGITEIRSLVFKPLKSLIHLDLSGNMLHNAFQETTDLFQYIPQLHFLSISHNNIVSMNKNIFQHFISLGNLDLSNNKIVSWNTELFSKLKQLKYLRLDNNKITSIYKTWMDSLNNLKGITLSGNPLKCDCLMGWILPWFKATKTNLVDANYTTCATPENLAGRKLMDLNPENFICPTPWYYILFIVILSICCAGIVVTIIVFKFEGNIRIYIAKWRRSHQKGNETEREMILRRPDDGFI